MTCTKQKVQEISDETIASIKEKIRGSFDLKSDIAKKIMFLLIDQSQKFKKQHYLVIQMVNRGEMERVMIEIHNACSTRSHTFINSFMKKQGVPLVFSSAFSSGFQGMVFLTEVPYDTGFSGKDQVSLLDVPRCEVETVSLS